MSSSNFSGTYHCALSHRKRVLWWWKNYFHFRTPDLPGERELFWRSSCGRIEYRLCQKEFIFDKGSVPPVLWGLPGLSSDGWEKSYAFHDNACSNGGLLVSTCGREDSVSFRKMSRKDADKLLRDMVLGESGSKITSGLIYFGVRVGVLWKRAWERANREKKPDNAPNYKPR